LDVFEKEPELAQGLADLENVVIVLHIASATKWTREGMATLAACNVAGSLLKRPAWNRPDVMPFLRATRPRQHPAS
jgi:hydroxypyruvate reductase 1